MLAYELFEDFPEHRRKDRVQLGDLIIDIDQHLDDQERTRNLSHEDVLEVLSKINHARRKIFDLQSGQKFWLYDPRLQTAIGMRLLNHKNKRIMLKTALGKNPGQTNLPVFQV